MTSDDARERMEAAWALRRTALDASPSDAAELLGEAKRALGDVVTESRQDGPPVVLAQALHLLANVEVDLEDLDAAEALWIDSIEILRGVDEPLQLAHKVRHLGDLHRRRGRLDEAEEAYSEALTLYRAHDAPGSLDFANAVRRVAVLAETRGDGTEAVARWRETRELYAAIGLSEGVEEAERHIEQLSR